ncbi:hypothetical protein QJQ45_026734 [Haematococcus lacustris]|nr:hypothetical protein QJQ45_026734 [Haematococcus lacustris]
MTNPPGYHPTLAVRGIALSLRAASAKSGDSTVGKSVIYFFFLAAGFGISIAISLLVLAGWWVLQQQLLPAGVLSQPASQASPCPLMSPSFPEYRRVKNTAVEYKLPAVFRIALISMFPCVIVLGPGEWLLQQGTAGMLIIAGFSLLFAIVASVWTWVVRPPAPGTAKPAPQQMVLVAVLTTSLLVWSAAVRVGSNFDHPELGTDEKLLFPLQVLPEMLQLAIWCVPTLLARVHLSSRWQEWWADSHPGEVSKQPGAQPLAAEEAAKVKAAEVSSTAMQRLSSTMQREYCAVSHHVEYKLPAVFRIALISVFPCVIVLGPGEWLLQRGTAVSPEVVRIMAAKYPNQQPVTTYKSIGRGSKSIPMRTDLQHMGMSATKHMTPRPSNLVRDKAYVCLYHTNSILAPCSQHGLITHCNLR